jgi:hypothetical protein
VFDNDSIYRDAIFYYLLIGPPYESVITDSRSLNPDTFIGFPTTVPDVDAASPGSLSATADSLEESIILSVTTYSYTVLTPPSLNVISEPQLGILLLLAVLSIFCWRKTKLAVPASYRPHEALTY